MPIFHLKLGYSTLSFGAALGAIPYIVRQFLIVIGTKTEDFDYRPTTGTMTKTEDFDYRPTTGTIVKT